MYERGLCLLKRAAKSLLREFNPRATFQLLPDVGPIAHILPRIFIMYAGLSLSVQAETEIPFLTLEGLDLSWITFHQANLSTAIWKTFNSGCV